MVNNSDVLWLACTDVVVVTYFDSLPSYHPTHITYGSGDVRTEVGFVCATYGSGFWCVHVTIKGAG